MSQKWGQHFLRSASVLSRIIDEVKPQAEDTILEIGPGEGVLTFPLAEKARTVHAFEIDPHLADRLEAENVANLKVHRGDFLKVEAFPKDLSAKEFPLTVVANLPYYITAPILERLCWQDLLHFDKAVLMMQEEVAKRVCSPGHRCSGALTYFVGLNYRAELLFTVPPSAFAPPPKVQSAVIRITPTPRGPQGSDTAALYEKLVHTAFRARRKQLGTSLKTLHPECARSLRRADIEPTRRPETLSVEEFWKLARTWNQDV